MPRLAPILGSTALLRPHLRAELREAARLRHLAPEVLAAYRPPAPGAPNSAVAVPELPWAAARMAPAAAEQLVRMERVATPERQQLATSAAQAAAATGEGAPLRIPPLRQAPRAAIISDLPVVVPVVLQMALLVPLAAVEAAVHSPRSTAPMAALALSGMQRMVQVAAVAAAGFLRRRPAMARSMAVVVRVQAIIVGLEIPISALALKASLSLLTPRPGGRSQAPRRSPSGNQEY